MSRYLWIRGKRYYHYQNYGTWKEAYTIGSYQNKRNKKNKYYIQKVEVGFVIPRIVYKLYMTNVFTI